MGEDPRDIERRIEDTRERMGDTVQALSDKADVPGRVKGYVGDKKDAVTSKLSGARDSTGELAGQATEGARRGAGMAQENPLGLAIGSIAAGFVVGMLLPTSRVENERLGPIADQVKDQVREVGGEAIEHGKQVAQEAAQAATDTARSTSREHAEDLQESLRDSARETAGQIRQ
jgi:gas vesicle protein